MTVSDVNNETREPNDALGDTTYNNLCHALATLQSALQRIANNASRMKAPDRQMHAAIQRLTIEIAGTLADAVHEIVHHDANRKHAQSTIDSYELAKMTTRRIEQNAAHNLDEPSTDNLDRLDDELNAEPQPSFVKTICTRTAKPHDSTEDTKNAKR